MIKKVINKVKLEYYRRYNLLEYNRLRYYLNTGRLINLSDPRTMDEKIIYMSFNTDTSKWSECADKVKVREYIKECGYAGILPVVFGVYDDANQIDFSILPNSFVAKTNNASGTNIIVRDKSKADLQAIVKKLNAWLERDYSKYSGDPHYGRIPPKILIEELLGDNSPYNATSLADYKFFCVGGKPVCVEMMTDRTAHSHKRRFYDMDWNAHDEWMLKGYPVADLAQRPVPFEEMKAIASSLSSPFKFVRVDFYVINDKPVFGELTFTPGETECSDELEVLIGNKIQL